VVNQAPAANVVRSAATESLQSSDLAATLWSKSHKPVRQTKPVPHEPKRRGIDVGAVITRALTAAGLMK
jgi:feruloyl esterase